MTRRSAAKRTSAVKGNARSELPGKSGADTARCRSGSEDGGTAADAENSNMEDSISSVSSSSNGDFDVDLSDDYSGDSLGSPDGDSDASEKDQKSVLAPCAGNKEAGILSTPSICVDPHQGGEDEWRHEAPRRISGRSFQSMCLYSKILTAVLRKGYRVPSPIQRAAIPLVLAGRDVVGMARTGSGKTAAFVIPMLQMLKVHSIKVGIRAMVLSPTRELAIQTFKLVRELSALTDLRSCLIVGGDNLEDHFAAIAGNPDIVVATPGRLMHLVVEMGLKLTAVEHVVLDEADRLLEMGFAVQLNELLSRLPGKRQTLLFSATLPESLAEFAKTGLADPALVRLDTDFKISRDLETHFIGTMNEARDACLVLIMENCIDKSGLTMIFVPTRHHAEYVSLLLDKMGFNSACIYGDMDSSLRVSRANMFRSGKVKVLVVTDLAARGIDIPLLDNVVNYTFPSSSKLFIHRVGRAGRAGRKGIAYSIVSPAEQPYMIDLQIFTGRPLVICPQGPVKQSANHDFLTHIVYGTIDIDALGLKTDKINELTKNDTDLATARRTASNAYNKYLKSIPPCSRESVVRSREIILANLGIYPLFKNSDTAEDGRQNAKLAVLRRISEFRPSETIFEFMSGDQSMRDGASSIKRRRVELSRIVERYKAKSYMQKDRRADTGPPLSPVQEEDTRKMRPGYISYPQSNLSVEKGLRVASVTPFLETSSDALLNIASDDKIAGGAGIPRPKRIWDSKKHRYRTIEVGADNRKLVKSESGALIPISFKSNRFENWKNKTKNRAQNVGDLEIESISAAGMRKMDAIVTKYKGLPRYRRGTGDVSQSKPSTSAGTGILPIERVVKQKLKKMIAKTKEEKRSRSKTAKSSKTRSPGKRLNGKSDRKNKRIKLPGTGKFRAKKRRS